MARGVLGRVIMRLPSGLPVFRFHRIAAVALLCLAPLARAQAGETITATANVKSSGGVAATATLSIAVDRFSTDTERDEILAALKKNAPDLALLGRQYQQAQAQDYFQSDLGRKVRAALLAAKGKATR